MNRRSPRTPVLAVGVSVLELLNASCAPAQDATATRSTSQILGGPTHSGSAPAADRFEYPTQRWLRGLMEAPSIFGPPTVAGEVAYFGGAAVAKIDLRTGDSLLSWQPDGKSPGGVRLVAPAADSEGHVYFLTNDGRVGCLDEKSKKALWTQDGPPIYPQIPWPVVVTDDLVIAAFHSKV